MSKEMIRYIEVTYKVPSYDAAGKLEHKEKSFAAVVYNSPSPQDALQKTIDMVVKSRPNAEQVELFIHRQLTVDAADKVRSLLQASQWGGWFDQKEAVDA